MSAPLQLTSAAHPFQRAQAIDEIRVVTLEPDLQVQLNKPLLHRFVCDGQRLVLFSRSTLA